MTHGSQWPQLLLTAQMMVLFKDTFNSQNKIKCLCQILFMQNPLLVSLPFDLYPCADISADKYILIQYNTCLHYDGKKKAFILLPVHICVIYMAVTWFSAKKCDTHTWRSSLILPCNRLWQHDPSEQPSWHSLVDSVWFELSVFHLGFMN